MDYDKLIVEIYHTYRQTPDEKIQDVLNNAAMAIQTLARENKALLAGHSDSHQAQDFGLYPADLTDHLWVSPEHIS